MRRYRRKKATEFIGLPPEQQELAKRIRNEIPDHLGAVVQDEIVPVVREALNEETLQNIKKMVGLAPAAIEALKADLTHDNPRIRQKATELILKYSVGHTAIVRPEEEDSKKQPIQINFALPRPGHPAELPESEQPFDHPATESEDEIDTRECDTCAANKPLTDFVESSARCIECFDKQQETAQAILAESTAGPNGSNPR